MLWIRAPGAQAQGQGSVRPLPWSRGQILRKNRTPLRPPRPQQGPGRLAVSQRTVLPTSGLAGAPGPARVSPACLPVPTQAPSPGMLHRGLDWGGFGAWPGSPSRPPAAAQPPPGLTDGHQGVAVLLVEVGPGLGLAVLAAGQDPIAAGAGCQAHPDGAAALVAELEEGNPAREQAGSQGAPGTCA